MNDDTAREWLAANSIETVRLESVALDGWLFGKHVSVDKFLRAAGGLPTADIAMGFDLGGTLMLGWWDEWRTELGDVVHRPDLGTLALTSRPGCAAVFADVLQLSGQPVPIDPRATLGRLVEHLDGLGYTAKVAIELEAYVFDESIEAARERSYEGLSPLGGRRPIGYSVVQKPELVEYMEAVVDRVLTLGIEWEGWSSEVGAGQIEFNVAPADPLRTADSIMRVKTAMREVAHEQGRSVTFMSKPVRSYGSGLHVNHSLLRDGEAVFRDPDSADGRSTVMRQWLGGLIASMPASMSLFSPFPTSYRRLVEADGPPTTVTWGENNKTTGIRSITRSAKETRLEHRVPAGDANPYLAIGAVLAGGIRGLEDEIEPPDEFTGMAWTLPATAQVQRLPGSITKAAAALRADTRFAEILGTELVRHWLETRRWEWLMFHTTGGDPDAFTGPWELERYFEWV